MHFLGQLPLVARVWPARRLSAGLARMSRAAIRRLEPCQYSDRGILLSVSAGLTVYVFAAGHGKDGSYMAIFERNKDQLSDPDMIKPGQVLRLP